MTLPSPYVYMCQYGYNFISLGSYGFGYPVGPKLSDIHKPAEHLMVTETSDDAWYNGAAFRGAASVNGAYARHKGRFANVLFVDGHVESRVAQDLVNSNPYAAPYEPFNYMNY